MSRKYSLFIHVVASFSILASIMIFVDSRISLFLYTVGLSSGMIALGVFSAAMLPMSVGILAFVWFCICPVIFLISYILAIKKHYGMFAFLVAVDALVVILWSIYSVAAGNTYGYQGFLPDLIISPIVAAIALRGIYRGKGDKEPSSRNEANMHKKSIRLVVIAMILFVAFGIGIGMYSLVYTVHNQLEVMDIPSQSKVVIGVLILLTFDPLLLWICHHARLENVRLIGTIAVCLLIFLSICVLATIIPLI